jgi:hypothetical protein
MRRVRQIELNLLETSPTDYPMPHSKKPSSAIVSQGPPSRATVPGTIRLNDPVYILRGE